MPERSFKRKARRESITSSVDEPECSSMRTENVPSISDKDFADLSEKIEKSVKKRIKDTEKGQREILKMIENLTSKIDSLADKTSSNTDPGSNRTDPENAILETRPIELNEFCQDISQHSGHCMSYLGVKLRPHRIKFSPRICHAISEKKHLNKTSKNSRIK